MAAAGGCFFRIKESYASLSPKEQQIADYLTQHPRQASGMSLEELAQACGSSGFLRHAALQGPEAVRLQGADEEPVRRIVRVGGKPGI